MIGKVTDIVNVWPGTHAHVGGVAAGHDGDGGDGRGAAGARCDPYLGIPGTKLCLDTGYSSARSELLTYTHPGTKLCLDTGPYSAEPEALIYSDIGSSNGTCQ